MFKTYGLNRTALAMRRFGFGVSDAPKLSANFVTNEYKQDGSISNFADLFNFSRAGKAWLVKDAGLQEYSIDVPRFDEGLLIEKSATNYAAWSFLPPEGSYAKRGVVLNPNSKWVYDGVEPGFAFLYPLPFAALSQGNRIFSTVGIVASFSVMRTGTNGATPLNHIGMVDYFVKIPADVSSINGLVYPNVPNQYPLYYQVESINTQELPTSPIKTTTASITRPADLLSSKILGTKLTGDWDSTLNLSIVNGQLVHSGYGKIRYLEIN
ncbi:hypothetical protein [Psychrobacter sp. 16-MNA-CIBAN-0192]|uniref:hypothetical protein n=1 Tax=Psychrobacter sp. 16-MNA-CIBAN-0192 TaxID=3140448 RepID=UPI0033188B22